LIFKHAISTVVTSKSVQSAHPGDRAGAQAPAAVAGAPVASEDQAS